MQTHRQTGNRRLTQVADLSSKTSNGVQCISIPTRVYERRPLRRKSAETKRSRSSLFFTRTEHPNTPFSLARTLWTDNTFQLEILCSARLHQATNTHLDTHVPDFTSRSLVCIGVSCEQCINVFLLLSAAAAVAAATNSTTTTTRLK